MILKINIKGRNASPDYSYNTPPVYPEPARRANIQGLVKLEVVVSDLGSPVNVTLNSSSGSELLDKSALEAVTTWRFKPAILNGIYIQSKVEVPVRFKLMK